MKPTKSAMKLSLNKTTLLILKTRSGIKAGVTSPSAPGLSHGRLCSGGCIA